MTGDYTRDWYASHEAYRSEYHAVADAIVDVLGVPSTVVDYGCGVGYILERLQRYGSRVRGFEMSPEALEFVPDPIRPHVIVDDMFGCLYAADMAVCTEVAEHLPASRADDLVALLAASSKLIVFSGATPGQGGNGHVNEQPHEYWIERFQRRSQGMAVEETARLRSQMIGLAPNMPWFGKNVMVFRKVAT